MDRCGADPSAEAAATIAANGVVVLLKILPYGDPEVRMMVAKAAIERDKGV
jgi:hypothetical protein